MQKCTLDAAESTHRECGGGSGLAGPSALAACLITNRYVSEPIWVWAWVGLGGAVSPRAGLRPAAIPDPGLPPRPVGTHNAKAARHGAPHPWRRGLGPGAA